MAWWYSTWDSSTLVDATQKEHQAWNHVVSPSSVVSLHGLSLFSSMVSKKAGMTLTTHCSGWAHHISGNFWRWLTVLETTLGENTKDPTTCRDSERIEIERLGQRLKMSSNGEPLGAGLHCIYTTLHEGYARLSMRLRTVQCYANDAIVELRLCIMTSRVATRTARGTGLD